MPKALKNLFQNIHQVLTVILLIDMYVIYLEVVGSGPFGGVVGHVPSCTGCKTGCLAQNEVDRLCEGLLIVRLLVMVKLKVNVAVTSKLTCVFIPNVSEGVQTVVKSAIGARILFIS